MNKTCFSLAMAAAAGCSLEAANPNADDFRLKQANSSCWGVNVDAQSTRENTVPGDGRLRCSGGDCQKELAYELYDLDCYVWTSDAQAAAVRCIEWSGLSLLRTGQQGSQYTQYTTKSACPEALNWANLSGHSYTGRFRTEADSVCTNEGTTCRVSQ